MDVRSLNFFCNAMLSGFHVVDGGLGSELMRQGVNIKDDPLWSAKALIQNPDKIKYIHKSFLKSGANIILTASYQASIDGFCRYGKCSESEASFLIKNSVLLAKEARQEFIEEKKYELSTVLSCNRLFVAGSVGPYGACLFDSSEYHGNYLDQMTTEVLMNWHRPRIKLLVEAGVDFLAVETIPALVEAEAILKVIKEFPNISCWVTFYCKDSKHLGHGETFYDAAMATQAYDQVDAVGVNCCSPDDVQGLLASTDGKMVKPFVVYPNSGKDWENPMRLDKDPAFATYVSEWLKLGATIVGGCCGTTPADIQHVKNVLVEST